LAHSIPNCFDLVCKCIVSVENLLKSGYGNIMRGLLQADNVVVVVVVVVAAVAAVAVVMLTGLVGVLVGGIITVQLYNRLPMAKLAAKV